MALFFCHSTLANDAEVPVVKFGVNGFTVEGENPLSEVETNNILSIFLGPHEGLEGLLEAAAELESAILNAGHSFHRVSLPQQTLKDGNVILAIHQILLSKIEISGNEHFPIDNIKRSIPGLKPGTVPDTKLLSKQLIVANNHPSKNVTIRMKQSETPGAVDAELDVQDQRPWHLFTYLNNIGTSKTGRLRWSAGGQHNNLLGFDDSITGTYTTSPGNTSDVKQWGLNYRIPIYQLSGSIDAYYSRSDVNSGTIQQVFDVSGAGKFLGASYTQTFSNIKNYRHRLKVGVDDKRFDNNVSFLGIPIGVDVRSRPLTLSYTGEVQLEKAQLRFNVSHARNLNGGALNSDTIYAAARSGASQNWNLSRYSANYLRTLDENWLMRMSWQGQYTSEPLISGEQFGIGGITSVRGFEERAVTGDKGNQATLEFSRPIFERSATIRLFTDVGHTKIISPAAGQITSQTLASIGAGLSWSWKKRLHFSVDYAHELNDGRTSDIGGTKTHASIFYKF